jgi:hypothetical protein
MILECEGIRRKKKRMGRMMMMMMMSGFTILDDVLLEGLGEWFLGGRGCQEKWGKLRDAIFVNLSPCTPVVSGPCG